MEREFHYISPEKLTYTIIAEILEHHKKLVLSDESVALIQKSKVYLDRKSMKQKDRFMVSILVLARCATLKYRIAN